VKVCTLGMFHLGTVTSACLASVGHEVIGLDSDNEIIENLKKAKIPIFEPRLEELILTGLGNKNLDFTSDPKEALDGIEVLWVSFDTPVDHNDKADIEEVFDQIKQVFPYLPNDVVVLISSQLPIGSVKYLENYVEKNLPDKNFEFCYSPENLRLGKAIEVFLEPDRIIVGVRSQESKKIIERLLSPISDKVLWTSVESAEMIKHAINSFLAASITFTNEIASICELVGANAKEVELGMKSESRIGPRAYVSPGGPFAGGTLARDIQYLTKMSEDNGLVSPLLSSILPSNELHKEWVRRKLLSLFPDLRDISIAIWGLTYKPGTNSLRRSQSVELCEWLIEQGSKISVHDPVIYDLPKNWKGLVKNQLEAIDAVEEAEVLIIATEWPDFQDNAIELLSKKSLIVIDINRHLSQQLQNSDLTYITFGESH